MNTKISTLGKLMDSLNYFDWLDWLGLMIVFVLICVLAILIWRRKHPKKDEMTTVVSAKLFYVCKSIVQSMAKFCGQSWRLRSSALTMPFSIVIGEAGCGKTELIDQYADWQGQHFRFYRARLRSVIATLSRGKSVGDGIFIRIAL